MRLRNGLLRTLWLAAVGTVTHAVRCDRRRSATVAVAAMRSRINGMRKLLVDTLKAKGVPGDFSFIAQQRGMFSFSGLTPQHVEAIKKNYAIYIVGSGRINVAGITSDNVGRLCEAIAEVVKLAPQLSKDEIVLVNLSGRGDKDVAQMMDILAR